MSQEQGPNHYIPPYDYLSSIQDNADINLFDVLDVLTSVLCLLTSVLCLLRRPAIVTLHLSSLPMTSYQNNAHLRLSLDTAGTELYVT